MLAVISPAKKMDFEPIEGVAHSQPVFQDAANELVAEARKLSVSDLCNLMKISEKLGRLNRERFQAFAPQSDDMNSKQAGFAFAGDTYLGLRAAELGADDLAYAQDHLRILSGLYGVLRPLDRIQPYRLEMGRRLKTARGNSLYDFWGGRIGSALDQASDGVVINLASNEYFKSTGKAMTSRVITPAFKEERADGLKMIGVFAKKARGAMARYIIQNRIEDLDGLREFNTDGYKYRADLSGKDDWVFSRVTP
ncbi:UPF0246 protein [Amylibacter marinus]|uniref:UPF0246 protein GCM10007939_19790 n=1 Tax=Amylibacter marinus TaxID=1475483 RepID=A0ABQ5VXB5_9RHOB|nr:peroxide stress protein YaaA [Amylibacter marinus]GLQ35696.1 UPF0246 protein [Amylibacter marinus]